MNNTDGFKQSTYSNQVRPNFGSTDSSRHPSTSRPPITEHDKEVEGIVVNVKAFKPRNQYEMPERLAIKKKSALNNKYQKIITADSETVKHLYKMLEPKVANFERVKKDLDDYDDLNDLRETNIGQRLAQLREKIYKN